MPFGFALALLLFTGAYDAIAATYKCTQPDGSVIYSDRVTDVGCEELQPPVINKGSSSPQKAPSDINSSTEKERKNEQAPPPNLYVKSPIRTIKLKVPLLSIVDVSEDLKKRGFYLADKGDLVLTDLEVSHSPNGYGPDVFADYHFLNTSEKSLELAVWAAGKAIGYDPRYLKVRLSVRLMLGADSVRFDGPSATMPLAVAVAAAILGDRLRPEVCMSGMLNEKLEIRPVGGLEEKIKGCRLGKYRELVIPSGQLSMDLALRGMSFDIKVTEVRTFEQAYEVITGNALRSLKD